MTEGGSYGDQGFGAGVTCKQLKHTEAAGGYVITKTAPWRWRQTLNQVPLSRQSTRTANMASASNAAVTHAAAKAYPGETTCNPGTCSCSCPR